MRFTQFLRSRPALLPAILFALVCLGTFTPAFAQTATPCNAATPWNAYCLQWSHDGRDTTGALLPTPATFRVEQRLGTTGGWTTVASGITTLRAYITNLAAGTYYFRVYANCSVCTEAAPSTLSPEIPITAPRPTPTPAVIVIAVTISQGAPPTAVQVNGNQVYASP